MSTIAHTQSREDLTGLLLHGHEPREHARRNVRHVRYVRVPFLAAQARSGELFIQFPMMLIIK
jgi:hypothetical protein